MLNIAEVVGKELYMTTMSRGILASGLHEILSSKGPYTVFVPSDMAFARLERGVVEDLLKVENKTRLTELLKHHIVAGKLNFRDLKNEDKLKALDGKELVVRMSWGKTSVDGAIIQNRDVKSSNGTIHSVDMVLQN